MRQNSGSGDFELGTMGYHADWNTHPNPHNVANSLPFAQIQGFFSLDLRIDSRYLRFMDPRLQKVFEMAVHYGKGPIHWLCSFLGSLYIAFYIFPTPRFELTLLSPCNFLQNLSFTLFICIVLTLHVPMVIYKWATHDFEAKARELVHVLTAKLLKRVGPMASDSSSSSSPSAAKGQQQPEQKRKSASKDTRFPSKSGVEGDDAKVSNDNVFHFMEIKNKLNRRSSGNVVMTYNTARSEEKTKHLSMTDSLMNLISGPKTYEYANKISHYAQIFIIAMGQICIVMSFAAFSFQTQKCPPEDVEFVAVNYDKFIGCFPLNPHGNQERAIYLLPLFYPLLTFMIMDIYPRLAGLLLISGFSIALIINIVKAAQTHDDHSFMHVIRTVSSPLAATILICFVMHQHIHRKLETFLGDLHKAAYLQLASATVYDSKDDDFVQQDSTEDLDYRGGHLRDMMGYGNFKQSQPLQYGGNYQSPYEQNQRMIRNVHSNAGYNAYRPFQQTLVIPQGMNIEAAPRINDTYRSVLQNDLHDMYIHKAGPESDDIDFEHTHAGDRSDTGIELEIDNQPALQIQPLSENALQYHTNYFAGQYGGLTKPLHRFIYDPPETTANDTQTIEKLALVEQSQTNEKHAHGISPGEPLGGGRGDKLSQTELQQNPKSPRVDPSESRESEVLPGIEQQQAMLSVLPSSMPLQSSEKKNEDKRQPVLQKGESDTRDTIVSDLTPTAHGPPSHTNWSSRLSSGSIPDSKMYDADTADDSFAYTYNYDYGHGQDAEKISDEGSRFHGKEGSRTGS